MKRHTLVSTVLNIIVVLLALNSWAQGVGSTISIIDIASLLGVIAFSLMFVHYAADAIAPKQDDNRDIQYIVSRIAVLVAIIAHPLLVSVYLITNGYGLPPGSYEKFVGSVWPVLLGWAALTAFISFELRGKLQRFEHYIFHANIVAMFLILSHGFLVGMVNLNGWFVWVWWLYLIAFAVIAVRRYNIYYAGSSRKWLAIGVVIVLTALAGMAGVRAVNNMGTHPETHHGSTNTAQSVKSAQQPTTDVAVSQAQLAASNGLNGADCWVAIDGTVYDTAPSREWRNGEHIPSNGQARCGQDLTSVLKRAPHGKEVLGKLTIVGKLEQ